MLQISLLSADQKQEMYIDAQDNVVGFTVITEDKEQYDFMVEKEEWSVLKTFIESQFTEKL